MFVKCCVVSLDILVNIINFYRSICLTSSKDFCVCHLLRLDPTSICETNLLFLSEKFCKLTMASLRL